MDYFKNYIQSVNNPLKELERVFRTDEIFLEEYLEESVSQASSEDTPEVLDVGCGVRPMHQLAHMFPQIRFVGIDDDEQIIEEAKRIDAESNRGCRRNNTYYEKMNFLDNKFSDERFSFIYSTYNSIGCLRTLNEYNRFFRESVRTLKSGRKIYVTSWKNDIHTTEFLKKYYLSIGLKIISIDYSKTITNEATFYRIDPIIIEKNLKDLGMKDIQSGQVGRLWNYVVATK